MIIFARTILPKSLNTPPLPFPPPPHFSLLSDPWFTEGNGLQYTYSVPHDVDGLRKMFGSDAAYVSLLQQQMANTTMWPDNAIPNPW